jgi:hypothetical protein
MNRAEMEKYPQTVYRRGFEDGTKAKKTVPPPAVLEKAAAKDPTCEGDAEK